VLTAADRYAQLLRDTDGYWQIRIAADRHGQLLTDTGR
jgi:hypothetical protein